MILVAIAGSPTTIFFFFCVNKRNKRKENKKNLFQNVSRSIELQKPIDKQPLRKIKKNAG